MDIFGVSDYTSSPECIACLTDPRDTILLPCRHLCVCSDCFDRLTLDRCPVCRAPFTSYLRFTDPAPDDDADADFICTEAAPAEAQSETSEAPSNEPFLPPEPSGSSHHSTHRAIDIMSDDASGGDPLGVSASSVTPLDERR